MMAIRPERRITQLIFLRFGFLHADHVRVLPAQPVEESLAGGGSDAVGIEGDDFHERGGVGWTGMRRRLPDADALPCGALIKSLPAPRLPPPCFDLTNAPSSISRSLAARCVSAISR